LVGYVLFVQAAAGEPFDGAQGKPLETWAEPKWEEFVYTPGIFVRVANTGVTGYGK
jgi:hypothetical protein